MMKRIFVKIFDRPIFDFLGLFAILIGPVLAPGLFFATLNYLLEPKPVPKGIAIKLDSISNDGNSVKVSLRHEQPTDWYPYQMSYVFGPIVSWQWGDNLPQTGIACQNDPYSSCHLFAPREGRRSVCAEIVAWSEWKRAWIEVKEVKTGCLPLPPPKLEQLDDY
jgi:hypothetical protein